MHPALLTLILAAAQAPAAAPVGVQRPRDPFVFRCTLDQKVRMVTLALHDEMWVAYDAQTCGLYKSWKGGVKFDGAVYTTVHGPTPTSRGVDYQKGLEGDVWFVRGAAGPLDSRARWRGYRLENGACVLLFDLELADGRAIRVEERPDFAVPESLFTPQQMEDWGLTAGVPGLVRRFHAPAVPEGLVVAVQVRSDAPKGRFIDAGGAAQERLIDLKDAQGRVTGTEIHSLVWLDANRRTNSVIQFFEAATLPDAGTRTGDAQTAPKRASEGGR